jgi:hypothetical protein
MLKVTPIYPIDTVRIRRYRPEALVPFAPSHPGGKLAIVRE